MSFFHWLSFFRLVLIFLCPFLLLSPESSQSLIIFLSICQRLTNLYFLVISPQSLIKCCACRTGDAQTLQIILQPGQYSPTTNPKTHRCCFVFFPLTFKYRIIESYQHSHPEQNSPLLPVAKTWQPWHFVAQNLRDSLYFINFKESYFLFWIYAYCEIKCGQTVIPSSWRHRLACVHNDQGSLSLGEVMPHAGWGPFLLRDIIVIITMTMTTRSWLFLNSVCEITRWLCCSSTERGFSRRVMLLAWCLLCRDTGAPGWPRPPGEVWGATAASWRTSLRKRAGVLGDLSAKHPMARDGGRGRRDISNVTNSWAKLTVLVQIMQRCYPPAADQASFC